MIVRDPYWEERQAANPQAPGVLHVNDDKPKPFGFGFGVHPPVEPAKTEWKKP